MNAQPYEHSRRRRCPHFQGTTTEKHVTSIETMLKYFVNISFCRISINGNFELRLDLYPVLSMVRTYGMYAGYSKLLGRLNSNAINAYDKTSFEN